MLETFASALHATALSRELRASIWLYPLVNTGHVVGIALLFGGIVPLDLRLLGWFRRVPLEHLAGTLVPVAMCGLGLAVATGALLFATQPRDYVGEPLFGIKLALISAAIANALLLRRSPKWALGAVAATTTEPRPAWRVAAAASILLWLGAITAGRLIGYR
jgi:hypothetical protein